MKGAPGVFIQPIGFLCDHVEILYDIDIAFREFASSLGMKLWRAESINDSPTLARAIADLARQRLSSAVGAQY
jgi:ferrochelatase